MEFHRSEANTLGSRRLVRLTTARHAIRMFECVLTFIWIGNDHLGRVPSVAILKLMVFQRSEAGEFGTRSMMYLTAVY